ncbi:translocation/assembly module TamB domain-containing protein [Dyella terrae]|uniref:translocation/assembly module TamB domain-containing protein n=1 Tax=Dyella terrae TaxID=522259 RepID=UPI001EFE68E0|nr:translocation/assembly module TamB domain-containing protein [Dyella terrae]ULU27145.1 translocation/assembly module TamB domain-containing protein [Dyella terrae]
MIDTNAPAPAPRPRRRWLRWTLFSLLALLLVLFAFLAWLLGTSSGLRFALARAEGFTNGQLTVQSADGRLVGPLDLTGLRYADGKGLDVKVAKAHLDLRVPALLRKRLHVLDLNVDGVDVALPPSEPDQSESQSSFSWQPPLDMVLDRAHVGTVKITQAGQPVFASDSLDLAGSWTSRSGIELRQLALRAPDGHADLTGNIVVGSTYRGDSKANFAWTAGGTEYAGELAAHGDGKHAHLDLQLTLPMPARLQLDMAQAGDYAWNATLDAPRFDPKPFLGDSSLTGLSVALTGKGDRRSGTVTGQLGLNDYQVKLQPLSARFSDDLNTLTLDQLGIASPQFQGSVNAHGVVQLSAKPLSADLTLDWKDVVLPQELAGQPLMSHGTLTAKGSAEQFHAESALALGPEGKLADVTLDLDGTQKLINLHALTVKQPQGDLQAKGTLTLQPALGWQLEAVANKFDPGHLLAKWNGSLDFDIASQGTLPQDHPDVTLEIRKLDGHLRDRTVHGDGKLHLPPEGVVDGKLHLVSGGSDALIDAKPGKANDVTIKLAIASLGDWLPEAAGKLQGTVQVRGTYPKLAVDSNLQGNTLNYAEQHVDTLHLLANVPDISHPGGKLDLQAGGVNAGGLAFTQVSVRGDGTAERHNLTLAAHGSPLSTDLALSGGLKGSAWNGSLSTLNIDLAGLPRWRLQQSTQLSYNDGALNLSELCLTAGEPLLCAAAKQDKAGNLDASYRLHGLPIALIMSAVSTSKVPMRVEGSLDGNGSIRRNTAGALTGNASITSPHGSVAYADRTDQPLVTYDNLALTAQLSPSSQQIELHAGLTNTGRVDGNVTISGAQQSLGGHVGIHVSNLRLLEIFTTEVVNPKGAMNGDFNLAGTLSAPAISGQANLTDFAAEIPAMGLKLSQGHVSIGTTDAQHFRIDGTLHSGDGNVVLAGTASLGADAQSVLTVKGSNFRAVDIPAAKVAISPDLAVTHNDKGLDITGSVALDNADVNLDKLPGAGATKASPDVVVVDDKQPQEAVSQMPLSATVTVNLGNKTHLVGMGLDGRLQGQLVVSERPGRATTGQGQIDVSGTYKAYGQNLQIDRGQLLFASTPIDNPGLNIRAIRKLNPNATIDDGQQVGLNIAGTAQRPVLTVFSQPPMEQSDALSYLITGKPLSQVKGGEGNMVGAAAQALGSATGNLLAKSIGSRLGLDDVGVSSSDALNGSSAFTMGKYLSPRLYISYGVGLFDPGQVITLRYHFNARWNFEAQSATDFNRASLNYRIER